MNVWLVKIHKYKDDYPVVDETIVCMNSKVARKRYNENIDFHFAMIKNNYQFPLKLSRIPLGISDWDDKEYSPEYWHVTKWDDELTITSECRGIKYQFAIEQTMILEE